MDDLFHLPSSPIAMPRAYWITDRFFLSSQVVVLEPSKNEWHRIQEAIQNHDENVFDMDILNTLYNNSALVFPHRSYALLTGEFRSKPDNHANYLGSPTKR
jgi:hypothetical protein